MKYKNLLVNPVSFIDDRFKLINLLRKTQMFKNKPLDEEITLLELQTFVFKFTRKNSIDLSIDYKRGIFVCSVSNISPLVPSIKIKGYTLYEIYVKTVIYLDEEYICQK